MKILVTGASGFVGGAYVRRYRGRAGLHFHGVGRRALNVADYTAADLSREATDLAARSDFLVARADALLDRAEVLSLAGHHAEASASAKDAIHYYMLKGNASQAANARRPLADN